MIDRDKFASEIYLRLLAAHPNKDKWWLQQEAFKHADEFVAVLRENEPPKQAPLGNHAKKRREVVTS